MSCKEEEQERSSDPKKHSLSKGVCVGVCVCLRSHKREARGSKSNVIKLDTVSLFR